jgi:hypothetical protein
MLEQEVTIARNGTVVAADGSLRIIETMFSSVCDLVNDHAELVARLHPLKKRVLDQVLADSRQSSAPPVHIELHVNNLHGGGVKVIDYATLAHVRFGNIIGDAHGRSFEPGAEPVIRQLTDKSFRLLFHAMPPRRHALGAAFDVDHFSEQLLKQCGADIFHDDRDVFYVARSARAADIVEIFTFLRDYKGPPRRSGLMF